MSEPLVTVERQGRAASLILNRPDKRNAINQAVLDDLRRLRFGTSTAILGLA
jgi:enoyl-CoA hydratase/carnithine racemase